MPMKPRNTRNLQYSLHLITYIDILGFRELVAEKSPNTISRAIRQVIENTAPDARILRENNENYINFSDLIVHTVPINSRANRKHPAGLLFFQINSLVHAQAVLIEEGLLIRGAIMLGEIERTYGVLFGPGLISAYDLEREYAVFPRIILDDDLIEALKTNPLLRVEGHEYEDEMEEISRSIKRDDDGEIFIDYLGGVQGEFNEPEYYFSFLQTHKDLIEKGIAKYKGNRRVLSKYLWLKKYHNAVIQSRLRSPFYEKYYVHAPNATPDVPSLMPSPQSSGPTT